MLPGDLVCLRKIYKKSDWHLYGAFDEECDGMIGDTSGRLQVQGTAIVLSVKNWKSTKTRDFIGSNVAVIFVMGTSGFGWIWADRVKKLNEKDILRHRTGSVGDAHQKSF